MYEIVDIQYVNKAKRSDVEKPCIPGHSLSYLGTEVGNRQCLQCGGVGNEIDRSRRTLLLPG